MLSIVLRLKDNKITSGSSASDQHWVGYGVHMTVGCFPLSGCSPLTSIAILSFPVTWLCSDSRVPRSSWETHRKSAGIKKYISVFFTNGKNLMRFSTAQICQSVIRNPWRFQEKSCHMQVVVDPLFPLADSAHKHASNYPFNLSPAYKIYDSAVTVLWQ